MKTKKHQLKGTREGRRLALDRATEKCDEKYDDIPERVICRNYAKRVIERTSFDIDLPQAEGTSLSECSHWRKNPKYFSACKDGIEFSKSKLKDLPPSLSGSAGPSELRKSVNKSIFKCAEKFKNGRTKSCVQGALDFNAVARRKYEGVYQNEEQVNRTYILTIRLCRKRYGNSPEMDACDTGAWEAAMTLKDLGKIYR